jgi:hypothetical protein
MSADSPEKTQIKFYLERVGAHRARNLAERACHELAAEEARREHPLKAGAQKKVDEWLDWKYPARLERSQGAAPSLFDNLPEVK